MPAEEYREHASTVVGVVAAEKRAARHAEYKARHGLDTFSYTSSGPHLLSWIR